MPAFLTRARVILAGVIISLTLSGCGFHLRESYLLSPAFSHLYIQTADPYGGFYRELEKRLEYSDVVLLDAANERYPTLVIRNDRLQRRPLSVYDDGQVAEYRLYYTVNARVNMPGEQEPVPVKLQVSRDYLDNAELALAKSRELDLLLAEMREQAADKLLRQLATIE